MRYNIFGDKIDSLALIERVLETQLYHINYDPIVKKRGDLKKEEIYSQDETKKDLQELSRT